MVNIIIVFAKVNIIVVFAKVNIIIVFAKVNIIIVFCHGVCDPSEGRQPTALAEGGRGRGGSGVNLPSS